MKNLFVWFLLAALVFTAACGKQPQNPVTPTEPAPPATEMPTEAPTQPVTEAPTQVPTEPVTEAPTETPTEAPTEAPTEPVSEPEPDGAVAAVMLLGNVIPDLGRLEQWMPLEGNALALLATREEQTRVLIFDMMEQTVLADCQVPAYGKNGSTRQLSILENDPRTLLYYDGRDYWKLAADDRWQLTAEEYDILQQSTEMGSHTVEQTKGGIAVDGVVPDGLKSDNNRVCTLAAIVDDHRLLYQYNGYTVSAMMDRYVGVYDHSTGQTRPLTTAGQQAWGVWGNTLLLVRGGGPVYDMGWVDLTDYTYTPLDIGHQTTADAVDTALCNADGTRLMVSWNDADGDHVQVFDLESGEVLYQWSAPQKNGWSFYPVDDNGLVVTRHADGAFPIWKVEY